MELVVVHWQGRLAWVTAVASLCMAEAGLLAGLELVVRLVLVLVHVLQEVRSQGRREWMRRIEVDHNSQGCKHKRTAIPSRRGFIPISVPSLITYSILMSLPTVHPGGPQTLICTLDTDNGAILIRVRTEGNSLRLLATFIDSNTSNTQFLWTTFTPNDGNIDIQHQCV